MSKHNGCIKQIRCNQREDTSEEFNQHLLKGDNKKERVRDTAS